MDFKKKIKKYLEILLFIFLIMYLLIVPQLRINKSPSAPLGIYYINRFSKNYKVNEYVVYEMPMEYKKYVNYEFRKLDTIKKIYAMEGDKIQIKDNAIYINEEFTVKGFIDNIPIKLSDRTLKKTEYLTLSNNEKSLDGRYYGVINKENIKYKAYLIYEFK